MKIILNKKGTTIIELIISIALLSVVMMFMYRLLADVTFERDSEYFASRNQEQRIEIEQGINDAIFDCYTKFAYSYYVKWESSSSKYVCTNGTNSTTIMSYSINNSTKNFKITIGEGSTAVTYDLGLKGVTNVANPTETTSSYTYYDKSMTDELSYPNGKPYNVEIHQVKILIGTDNTYNNAQNEKTNNTIDDIVFSYERKL